VFGCPHGKALRDESRALQGIINDSADSTSFRIGSYEWCRCILSYRALAKLVCRDMRGLGKSLKGSISFPRASEDSIRNMLPRCMLSSAGILAQAVTLIKSKAIARQNAELPMPIVAAIVNAKKKEDAGVRGYCRNVRQ
jgi:hypothetical protein